MSTLVSLLLACAIPARAEASAAVPATSLPPALRPSSDLVYDLPAPPAEGQDLLGPCVEEVVRTPLPPCPGRDAAPGLSGAGMHDSPCGTSDPFAATPPSTTDGGPVGGAVSAVAGALLMGAMIPERVGPATVTITRCPGRSPGVPAATPEEPDTRPAPAAPPDPPPAPHPDVPPVDPAPPSSPPPPAPPAP